ncbi:hypothetical protein [Streptomyces sp. NPDC050600]|uniref:hypothetical protein n=1 Tax=unclassified Streptomyces TaxID=2593676 RepID=UPI00343C0239
MNTAWVGDGDGGKGRIEFPQAWVNVSKDGTQAWGTLTGVDADQIRLVGRPPVATRGG